MLAKVGAESDHALFRRWKSSGGQHLRLTSPTVIAHYASPFPDLPEQPDQRTVFLVRGAAQSMVTTGKLTGRAGGTVDQLRHRSVSPRRANLFYGTLWLYFDSAFPTGLAAERRASTSRAVALPGRAQGGPGTKTRIGIVAGAVNGGVGRHARAFQPELQPAVQSRQDAARLARRLRRSVGAGNRPHPGARCRTHCQTAERFWRG